MRVIPCFTKSAFVCSRKRALRASSLPGFAVYVRSSKTLSFPGAAFSALMLPPPLKGAQARGERARRTAVIRTIVLMEGSFLSLSGISPLRVLPLHADREARVVGGRAAQEDGAGPR